MAITKQFPSTYKTRNGKIATLTGTIYCGRVAGREAFWTMNGDILFSADKGLDLVQLTDGPIWERKNAPEDH